jgi:hypothetical protein
MVISSYIWYLMPKHVLIDPQDVIKLTIYRLSYVLRIRSCSCYD